MGLDFLTIDQYFTELQRKKGQLEERIACLGDALYFSGLPRHKFPRGCQTRLNVSDSLAHIASHKLPVWHKKLEAELKRWKKLSTAQKTAQESKFRSSLDKLLNEFRNLTADVECRVSHINSKKKKK